MTIAKDTPAASPLIEVRAGDSLLAIIVRAHFEEKGIRFLTSSDLSQQLAVMCHPAGKVIAPHVHNPVTRQVTYTQEALFIRKGSLRVDFYDERREYVGSYKVSVGDVVFLIKGGHGFEVLEEADFIEVKQGPYAGDHDKTRFLGIHNDQVEWAE